MEQVKSLKVEQENQTIVDTTPIRVKQETKRKIDDLLERINKKDIGRKVRSDELVLMALSLVESEHIKQLRENSLTNADRFELAYRRYSAKNKSISKDTYLGLVMAGKVPLLSEQMS